MAVGPATVTVGPATVTVTVTVTVTRNGRAAAVIVFREDLAALAETLAVLGERATRPAAAVSLHTRRSSPPSGTPTRQVRRLLTGQRIEAAVERDTRPLKLAVTPQEGASRGEPGRRHPIIAPCIPAAISADPAKALAMASWWVSFYLMSMGPLYRRTLLRLGHGRVVE